MAKKFYAVRAGRKTGIFLTWNECKSYVIGYPGAEYKGFETKEEAVSFMNIGVSDSDESEKETENAGGDKAVAYVDGSYNIHDKRFSYGAVILYKGEEYRLNKAFEDEELAEMRNVAGEIKGSEAAMQFFLDNNISEADIYHDYEGVAKWCRGEWKTNRDGTKKYAEFYKKVCEKVKINFIKVKGHSGDKYNDIADRLAKDALGIK